jgi:hypothetical protein
MAVLKALLVAAAIIATTQLAAAQTLEWRNAKRWLRIDYTDIGEVECLPDLNDNLPSTQAGQAGLER